MTEQQICQVAEKAFKRYFGDVSLCRVNVRREFDYDEDDPMVDVSIVYDGKQERLDGARLLRVQTEIVDKVWRDDEDSPGFPLVHFFAKSALGRRDPETV